MNRTRFLASTLACGVLLAVSAPRRLAAQVGHDPSHSPYRDILHGNGWTVTAGRIYGDGGPLQQSPNSGTSVGLRYDVRFSRLLQGFVGLSRAATTRRILNPDDSIVHRYGARVDQPVWLPEFGLQMNLSGSKTWHGLAPFVAAAMGAATSSDVKADTSGFSFGTKLLFAPSIGTRFYLGQRLHVRLEGQLLYWKMKYPSTWTREPAAQPSQSGQPTTAPVKDVTGLNDWLHTPALRFGVGYSF
ncbi:MAG TPA: hypothetical protein VFI13_13615 [Gemmatimonadales bacterium]|nr:hypothetical protein [Gemmatimonadales bacterium]